MAPRQMKMPTKEDFDNEVEEVFSQRKRPESGRYLLQVDRQTKGSYKTSEAAQAAGREIKAAYPIVEVSIYDSIDSYAHPRGGNAGFISAGEGCSGNRRSAIAAAHYPPEIGAKLELRLFAAIIYLLCGPPARKSDKGHPGPSFLKASRR